MCGCLLETGFVCGASEKGKKIFLESKAPSFQESLPALGCDILSVRGQALQKTPRKQGRRLAVTGAWISCYLGH